MGFGGSCAVFDDDAFVRAKLACLNESRMNFGRGLLDDSINTRIQLDGM